jgi:hypothetical protein
VLQPQWKIFEHPACAMLTVRLPAHLTADVSRDVTTEMVVRLRAFSEPIPVVVDLYDVERFDVAAPMIAVRIVAPVVRLIDALDIIVRNRALRVAAITAAHVLGVPYQLRELREQTDPVAHG